MLHVPADLGQRILELARIAAAMHLEACAGADDVLMSEAPGGAGIEHAPKDGGARLLRHTPRIDFGIDR
ncbi:MAG TPA: hypothetical protein VEA69_11810 [Tepidisphaeraceae bacterium]|nr:hypothetical protein [Tepidisphaeraceae bacterium]